jgi:hypothetical protein
MDTEPKARGIEAWASNTSVGIGWAIVSAALLALLLSTPATFEVLRDGFRLGTVGLIGAGLMLISSIWITVGSFREDTNHEFHQLLTARAFGYVALILLSLAVFGYVLTILGLAPAIALYSGALYFAFGVRRPLLLAICIVVTTVFITAIFAGLGNHIRII